MLVPTLGILLQECPSLMPNRADLRFKARESPFLATQRFSLIIREENLRMRRPGHSFTREQVTRCFVEPGMA